MPLCIAPPTSVLRQHIQILCCLDAELDFAADFCPPSPVASSQPLRLADGRRGLGTSIQMAMVNSLAPMVTRLQEQPTYTSFKAWLSVVKDWLSSNTHTTPNNLGSATVCTLSHLTLSPDVYSWLETCSALGMT